MTSLKEEIFDILDYFGATICTDQIMKLFEKRIDELQKAIKPNKPGIYTHKEMDAVESNVFIYIKEMLK